MGSAEPTPGGDAPGFPENDRPFPGERPPVPAGDRSTVADQRSSPASSIVETTSRVIASSRADSAVPPHTGANG